MIKLSISINTLSKKRKMKQRPKKLPQRRPKSKNMSMTRVIMTMVQKIIIVKKAQTMNTTNSTGMTS